MIILRNDANKRVFPTSHLVLPRDDGIFVSVCIILASVRNHLYRFILHTRQKMIGCAVLLSPFMTSFGNQSKDVLSFSFEMFTLVNNNIAWIHYSGRNQTSSSFVDLVQKGQHVRTNLTITLAFGLGHGPLAGQIHVC